MSSNNRAAELAARFKEKAQAARKEIELPVPLASDPGFTFPCVVRRVDLVTLVTAKEAGLPEHFVNSILGTINPEKLQSLKDAAADAASEAQQQGYTVEDLRAIGQFIRKVAQETCLEPYIYFSKDQSYDPELNQEAAIDLDAFEYAHCAEEIIKALYEYGLKLSPDVPVKMKGGQEASLESIGNFPQRPALSDAVHDGREVSPSPIIVAANP